MNSTCPGCDALYNVTEKDIGRRLKCKKCGKALQVTAAGLEFDAAGGSRAAPAVGEADDDRRDDYEDYEDRPRKEEAVRPRDPRLNPLDALNAVGGIPTIVFAAGVFLVIVFIAMPLIGQAGSARAAAYKERLENDRDREIFNLKPNKKRDEWTDAEKKKVDEETPKIVEKYSRLVEEADLDAKSVRISNTREAWLERYGLMFGFVFVAFGCIGYLRTEQPLVVKIVAGVILAFMMMIMFMLFAGCTLPR